MDEMRLKNFRCFRETQTARLAPLTLLVGENSTGKTSFMALVRALWDAAYRREPPDFKESPYDLGSFDEIAHYRGGRAGRAEDIQAGITSRPLPRGDSDDARFHVDLAFRRTGTVPVPVRWRLARGDAWIEERVEEDSTRSVRGGTASGSWQRIVRPKLTAANRGLGALALDLFDLTLDPFFDPDSDPLDEHFMPLDGSSPITNRDYMALSDLSTAFGDVSLHSASPVPEQRPFASAPVRSRPRRTYDPARPVRDPEGSNIPMYLSEAFFENKKLWRRLKAVLEQFGQEAGLFDEISVRPLGKRGSKPFQMHVRKYGGKAKGPMRNLIDVGYGVSQVLPVITELFRDAATPMFLLQQPEVHLHPSAQAALGSLFCRVAERGRQVVVETHSDHLLDRVRMDVRDGAGSLAPDDVSILFFERSGLSVRIHSLRLDGQGNVLGAPDGYRRFFVEETTRSLGL